MLLDDLYIVINTRFSVDIIRFLPTYIIIIINLIVVVYLLKQYLETKNRVISLLMLSMLSFLASNVTVLFVQNHGDLSGEVTSFEMLFAGLSGILYTALFLTVALQLLIFYFQAFREETIYTTQNIFHIVVTVTFFVVGQLNLAYLSIIPRDNPAFFTQFSEGSPDLPALQIIITVVSFISLTAVFIYVIILSLAFLHEVRTSLNGISNPKLKPIATRMKYSIYLMVISALFSGPNNGPFGHMMSLVFIIAIIVFIYFYRQGGLFFLQGDDLKRLIIMNNAGIPIYSYSFRSFNYKEEQSLSQQENEEILFSGALKSISILLSEFAGGQQAVTEIKLEELIMNVERFDNQCSAVLMVERTSPFIQEALSKFVERIANLVMEISPDRTFSNDQIKFTNQVVETVFGQSLVMV